MKRRTFLSSVGMASLGVGLPRLGVAEQIPSKSSDFPHAEVRLAGVSLPAMRQSFHDELFQSFLPFWDQHGVDHEYGGVMCTLDYDGTRINTDKLLWFQGRALWVYSFLYNHFGKNPRHLEIARKTKDFLLKYGQSTDSWWAEKLTREGKVLQPFRGDLAGMYFVVEGLQEYAVAAEDDQAREVSFLLLKKLFLYFNRPDFRYSGPDFPNLKPDGPCVRPQGMWMLNLNNATQMLQRWHDPEIQSIADHALDAILHRHYNPEIGLNTEMLYFDFTRPEGEERKVRLGHGIEVLWMAMDEADRRGDRALWETCAERLQHHLNVGWDHVYGGLAQWVNIDQGGYQWPPETPVGTNFAFRFVGEYNYMKTLWGMNEVLIATLRVFERTGAEWAARYFGMAHQVMTEKFYLKKRHLPGCVLFTDRRFTFEPHASRQDNYHPIRQLMLNILTLDRMISSKASRTASARIRR